MKYRIGINQTNALKLNLHNIQHAIIFDLIANCAAWSQSKIIDNQTFYWLSRNKICDELPLLDLKPESVYRIFKHLEDDGLIVFVKDKRRDMLRLTPKGMSYFDEYENNSDSHTTKKQGKLYGNSTENRENYTKSNRENNTTYTNTSNNIHRLSNNITRRKNFKAKPRNNVDVFDYMIDRGLTDTKANTESIKFVDFYESKGWYVGKTKMRDWKAAVRNWLRNGQAKEKSVYQIHQERKKDAPINRADPQKAKIALNLAKQALNKLPYKQPQL